MCNISHFLFNYLFIYSFKLIQLTIFKTKISFFCYLIIFEKIIDRNTDNRQTDRHALITLLLEKH